MDRVRNIEAGVLAALSDWIVDSGDTNRRDHDGLTVPASGFREIGRENVKWIATGVRVPVWDV